MIVASLQKTVVKNKLPFLNFEISCQDLVKPLFEEDYEVPFVKYVLHALYGQLYAFSILSQNGNHKNWTAFCGL